MLSRQYDISKININNCRFEKEMKQIGNNITDRASGFKGLKARSPESAFFESCVEC